MDMMETLKALEQTLNRIETHGSENLDRLLGCILTVRKLQKQLQAEAGDVDHG